MNMSIQMMAKAIIVEDHQFKHAVTVAGITGRNRGRQAGGVRPGQPWRNRGQGDLMKTPWHYLVWQPPAFDARGERNVAAITRRRGWLWALLLFWGVADGSSVKFGRVRVFISYNYAGLVAGLLAVFAPKLGLGAGWVAVIATIGLGWLVTVVWGTAKYVGWLASILSRWPPTGRA